VKILAVYEIDCRAHGAPGGWIWLFCAQLQDKAGLFWDLSESHAMPNWGWPVFRGGPALTNGWPMVLSAQREEGKVSHQQIPVLDKEGSCHVCSS
jgi:hypothetical protein